MDGGKGPGANDLRSATGGCGDGGHSVPGAYENQLASVSRNATFPFQGNFRLVTPVVSDSSLGHAPRLHSDDGNPNQQAFYRACVRTLLMVMFSFIRRTA